MSESVLQVPIVQDGGQLRAILPSARMSTKQSQPYPTPERKRDAAVTPGIFPTEETSGYRWANWGDDDMWPTHVRRKIEAVPMAGRAVYQLTQMMYGNGIGYYRNRDLETTNRPTRARIPVVEQFLKRSRVPTHGFPAKLLDYRFYMNTFSEMVLSTDRRQVTGIFHKEAEFSRLSIQNEETGRIEWLYYSPRFANGYQPRQNEIAAIELIDHWDQERWLAELEGYKFAWHSKLHTPGVSYYARPLWAGLFKKDGWLDVSAAVPKIISSMQHQQVILKYHMLIPESYFIVRYPDWQSYPNKKREILIDALIEEINDTLSGTDNVYASVATVFRDHANGQPEGKIEIHAVDDKLKKEAWVPSSEAADGQIVQVLGLHPSQVGLAPAGGKMGAGSGSDQRESFNTGITLNTMEQCILLEDYQWAADFNARHDPENWDITFFVDHTHHTTTNNVESGLVPSDQTIQPQ